MTWAILLVAALCESVWAVALKQADGFTKFWPTVIGVPVAIISLALLTIALRSLPVGTAYTVWVGVGVVGVAIAGVVLFGEALSPARVGFLALILVGVIGLKLVES